MESVFRLLRARQISPSISTAFVEVRTYHEEMQSLIEHTWRQLGSLYERCLDFVRIKGCSRSWLGRRRVTRQQDRAKVDHLRQP